MRCRPGWATDSKYLIQGVLYLLWPGKHLQPRAGFGWTERNAETSRETPACPMRSLPPACADQACGGDAMALLDLWETSAKCDFPSLGSCTAPFQTLCCKLVAKDFSNNRLNCRDDMPIPPAGGNEPATNRTGRWLALPCLLIRYRLLVAGPTFFFDGPLRWHQVLPNMLGNAGRCSRPQALVICSWNGLL